MVNKDGVTLTVAVFVVIFLLFQGFVTLVKKAFKGNPKVQTATTDTMATEQRRRTEDNKERQKRTMEDQKQRIRDMSRR